MKLKLLLFLIFVLFIGACTTTTDSGANEQDKSIPEPQEPPELPPQPPTSESDVNEQDEEINEEKEEDLNVVEEELVPTPNQVEGPYYPISKPDDSDENLRLIGDSSELASGTPLEVSGILVDENQVIIEGGVVEIWQADGEGYYSHPKDPGHEDKDPNFQTYGESITNENGEYFFETILPGLYGNRPRHIHVKVRVDGEEVLTTQFYFVGDERLPKDLTYRGGGDDKEAMLLMMAERTNEDGTVTLVSEMDIKLGATNDPQSARKEYNNR